MRHPHHTDFIKALAQLADARESFGNIAEAKLILGNDNHIGDIGEYWVRRFYEHRQSKCYGAGKNCPYDLKLNDGTAVSIKTLTAWSETGYGTPIRPLDGKYWQPLRGGSRGNQSLAASCLPLPRHITAQLRHTQSELVTF
jgi:hypothetical protein